MRTGFLETMAKEGLTDLAYFKYISPLTTKVTITDPSGDNVPY